MDYLNMNKEALTPVVKQLNILLSDYNLYYQKLRNFHWNIKGHSFFDLHNKFEEMYNDAKLKVDEIAERILTLNFNPISRFSDYLSTSSLEESESLISDEKMVQVLLKDHSILLVQMKKTMDLAAKAEDEGTIDLVGAYMRELEKDSWMLNAWLNK
ncbi:DNA starvation/stationary phase protection protein [uncultured Winogradskyella sp.]|uniref:Dps family protein n=1 Tax=uncultured Winogradskyella sp. TaxID=395353 RepID=UPI0026278BAC|nr:DNA starvation/stationary phase protection protein [uncultured Winogradskyella sp.]